MEDENELCLIEEWDTQENIKRYVKPEHFRGLRGAMNLLREPYEMMFHTVFHPEGMKEVNGQITFFKMSSLQGDHDL